MMGLSVPVSAYAAPARVSVDETLYLNLDHYGTVSRANIVKGIDFRSVGSYTDYGDYLTITNMSTRDEPFRQGDAVTWQKPEKVGKFFFEGTLDPASVATPWTFDITYKLNGVVTDPEKLGGASGLIELDIDALPNPRASEYLRNNAVLAVVIPVDIAKCYSVDAPDAQTASIGETSVEVFEALPGKEGHFTIRIGTDSYESIGTIFLMTPATVGDLEKIKDLKELKDKFRNNTNAMMDDVESLMDNVTDVGSQLDLTNQALRDLQSGKNKLHSSSAAIFNGVDVSIQDLRDLSGDLTPLSESLRTGQWLIYDLNQVLNAADRDVLDAAAKMKTLSSKLRSLGNAMGGVDNLTLQEMEGELKSVQGAIKRVGATAKGNMTESAVIAVNNAIDTSNELIATAGDILDRRSEEEMTEALTEYVTGEHTEAQVNVMAAYAGAGQKAKEAGAAYQTASAELTEAQAAAEALPEDASEEERAAASALVQEKAAAAREAGAAAQEAGAALDQAKSTALSAGVKEEELEADTLTDTLTGVRERKTEAEKVSRIAGVLKPHAEEMKQEIHTINAASQERVRLDTRDTAAEIADTLLDFDEDLEAIFGSDQTAQLLIKISRVSSEIDDILSKGGAVAFQTARFVNSARDLASDMDELTAVMNAYYEDIQTMADRADTLLLQTEKAADDLAVTLQTVNNTLRAAEEDLNRAADAAIAAGSQAVDNSRKIVDNTKNLKNSGADLRKSINDELDEQEADNNFLNMDPYAEKVSLTSDRNPSPDNVSIICRTEEITAPDIKPEKTLDAEISDPETTPLERIRLVFLKIRDIFKSFLG